MCQKGKLACTASTQAQAWTCSVLKLGVTLLLTSFKGLCTWLGFVVWTADLQAEQPALGCACFSCLNHMRRAQHTAD